MITFFNRYATPLITGLFLVSLISGVALFFHMGQATFHEMHEVLSMVLIVPFALHIWKNWRPVTAYLKHRPMYVALSLSLVASLAYAIPANFGSTGTGGPAQFVIAQKVLNGSVATVAPLFGTDAEGMTARLTAAGFTVTGADETLAAIAQSSGYPMEHMAETLVAPAN